jgi:phosphate starvation-inducible protein PhoH and related proteins
MKRQKVTKTQAMPTPAVPEGIKFELKSQFQRDVVKSIQRNSITVLIGSAGTGKTLLAAYAGLQLYHKKDISKIAVVRLAREAHYEKIGALPGCQPYHSKVATPTGWQEMGNLKIGDLIIAADGKAVEILDIFKKGIKAVYKVTTTNGKVTECCSDHVWLTQTAEEKKRKKPFALRTTAEILETIDDNKCNVGLHNHYLPANGLVEYVDTQLPISPYTLGYLLGNGYFGDGINLATIDADVVDRVNSELLDLNYKLTTPQTGITYTISSSIDRPNKPCREVVITQLDTGTVTRYDNIGDCHKDFANLKYNTLQNRVYNRRCIGGIQYGYEENPNTYSNVVKNRLYNLGLMYHTAAYKFIPKSYLYTGVENRLNLLRGLMDSDGTIKKSTAETSYTTVSEQLAIDIQELVRSLGGECTIYTRDRRDEEGVVCEDHLIQNKLVSYELSINLDTNPFFLERKAKYYRPRYRHGDGIKSIEYLYDKEVQCLLIDHPDHLYLTDNFIVTHNTLTDKLGFISAPVYDNLELMLPRTKIDQMVGNNDIEILPISFLRGRSLHNTYLILEEAQNLPREAILTVLTRIAAGSKIVVTCDPDQQDFEQHQSIPWLQTILAKVDDSAVFTMPATENYRHPIISSILANAKSYQSQSLCNPPNLK